MNFGNFRNTSDDLWQPLGYSELGFCGLTSEIFTVICSGVTFCTGVTFESSALLLANSNQEFFSCV